LLVLQGEYQYFAENDSRWDDMFDDENRYYGHLGDFWAWYVERLNNKLHG